MLDEDIKLGEKYLYNEMGQYFVVEVLRTEHCDEHWRFWFRCVNPLRSVMKIGREISVSRHKTMGAMAGWHVRELDDPTVVEMCRMHGWSLERKAKQVIVMRQDLRMRRGKEIAQGAHAANSFIVNRMKNVDGGFLDVDVCDGGVTLGDLFTPAQRAWMSGTFTKICVRIDSEEELLEIYKKALAAGLEVHMITDAGLTEFNGIPTKTCLAIGPDWADEIDVVTGHLKLY